MRIKRKKKMETYINVLYDLYRDFGYFNKYSKRFRKCFERRLFEREKEAIQDAINDLNKSIFNLNRAIELRSEGFKADNKD